MIKRCFEAEQLNDVMKVSFGAQGQLLAAS